LNDRENTISEIKAYLTDPEHPFKPGEFSEFWMSLTNEERASYRKADLTK
jgi:hypothetical protein